MKTKLCALALTITLGSGVVNLQAQTVNNFYGNSTVVKRSQAYGARTTTSYNHFTGTTNFINKSRSGVITSTDSNGNYSIYNPRKSPSSNYITNGIIRMNNGFIRSQNRPHILDPR